MDSSDDDIPGLESVSGSEYIEESEEESEDDFLGPDEEVPKPPHLFTTSLWLMFDASILAQHVDVIRVYVLSPFLYGHAHQSDKWLKWCHEVGLLHSDIEFNLETLTDREIAAMDIILRATKFVRRNITGESKELARIFQLMEKVELQETAIMAARTARKWKWFTNLIEDMRKSAGRDGLVPKEYLQSKVYFVEIGCLFVFNQVNDHINSMIKGTADYQSDFQRQITAHEEGGEGMREEGEELEKEGKIHEAIETYNTAVICCPYYYRLYINRAYALAELKNFRAAIGDGLRAVNLKPNDSMAYCCYVKALQAAGDESKIAVAIKYFSEHFSGDLDDVKRSRDQLRHKYAHKRSQDPTEHDRLVNDNLLVTCKQASQAYLAGNMDEAVFYFQEALTTCQRNDTWKVCWVFSDCEKFLISLHFAYGMSLWKKGGSKNAEKAIVQFNTIISDYQFITFPPAYYGMGKSLALLHNHTEASDYVKKGLDLMSKYRLLPLDWPGTSQRITECLPHDVEAKLQQLQRQCKPSQLADAVCRYSNCLLHHNSSNIILGASDYKGHIQMQCDEGCYIAYHPSCWRRFKSDSVVGSDRDFLATQCPTPDCEGRIKCVSIHDGDKKNKVKKFEAELPSRMTTPSAPPTSLIMTTKESKRSTQAKHANAKKKSESVSSKVPGDSMAVTEKEKEEGKMKEDLRRVEDSLAVINRHAEQEEEEQDANGAKAKVKKKSQPKEKSKASSELLNDLFSHPERKGSCDNDSPMSKWEPDPSLPFVPPKHLREMIDEFEMNEAPAIGLSPRPVGSGNGTTAPTEEPPKDPSADFVDEDLEFFVSYFGEILRTHGPLYPKDPKILEPLNFLPEDRKEKIEKAGGITKLLVDSGHFAMQGELVCPVEELGIVAASIGSSNLAKRQIDKKSKDTGSKAEETSIAKSFADGTRSTVEKSSLSGLLSVSGGGINQPVVGSKLNTSALNVKVTSPAGSPVIKEKGLKTTAKKSDEIVKKPRSRKERDSVALASKRKGAGLKVEEEPRKIWSRGSSKDSSVTSSGNEGSSGRSGGAEPRDVFSPTNSTSSMSSESSTAASATMSDLPLPTPNLPLPTPDLPLPTPNLPLLPPQATTTSRIGKKNKIPELKNKITKPAPVKMDSGIQTDSLLRADKWVMTDTIPPVESFKERYENVLKEKKDLQQKLERSEDQRFKLQKTHKREMEQMLKQTKQETKEEYQSRLRDMEDKVKCEGARVESVRKENSEQLRSSKAEVKSLLDKIERMKKDLARKDTQHENKVRQLRGEVDQYQAERRRYDDRLKGHKEAETKAIVRATNAEVEVLSMRGDLVVKPWEQKIRELEAMCMTIPQGSDLYQECMSYRDKMKSALEAYQSAVESQLRQVKAGRDLTSLERIPNPAVPMPPQLGMLMMRPGFYHPMMSLPRAPFGMGGMVDPASFIMNKPRPQGPRMTMPMSMSQAEPYMNPRAGGVTHLGLNLDGGEKEPVPTATTSPSEGDMVNGITGGGGGKKSSFDRIVEKLGPMYPTYTREDFKVFLREVRRSNKNTLSGLSLDSIAQQVKGIIEQQERKGGAGGGARGGGAASKPPAKGTTSKTRPPPEKKSGKKSRLPPVAVAPPPVSSSMDYDENSCIICYEEMGAINTSRLDCGHSFHSECIRSWFKEQSTCPTCRNHSLLVEEYPTLK